MGSERTLVTRWKSVVDPSVKRSADQVGDESEKASKRTTSAWSGVGSKIGGLVGDGLSMVVDRAGDFIGDSFRAASDLKEAANVTGLAFGDQAKQMERFFKTAAGDIGMSETAARSAAANVGGLLQNMGIGNEESAKWSKTLLGLSADMGSAFNKDPADAIAAIGAGLRGESEPLKQFNVMISDAKLKAKALEMGLYDGKGALDDNAKAQAALALIMEQTKKVQGDFANTSDGAANAARVQAAKLEDLKAKFADSLLPAQELVLGFMNDKLIPGFSAFIDVVTETGSWIQENQGWLSALAITIGIVAVAIGVLTVAQQAQAAGGFIAWISSVVKATQAWSGVQALLNVVMSANPIALVVIAVAALVAGIIYAYQNCEEFRKVVDTAFTAIGDAGAWLWNNALQPVIQAIVKGFAWVVGGIADMLDALGNVPGFEWAKDAAKNLRNMSDRANDAADSIGKIPDRKNVQIHLEQTGIRELQLKTSRAGVKVVAVANGGILQAFAGGGFAERHVAQIAAGGAMRLWAEPETGGESYIPLAPSKRKESIPIWWETGRRLGVVANADGALYGGSGSGRDEVLAVLARLADRVITVDDLDRLITELRYALQKTPPVGVPL